MNREINETVRKLVDIAFSDSPRTEEVACLYEQVLMDCQERYEDMMMDGRDEDDAIAAVVESLMGMEEVLRDLREPEPIGTQDTESPKRHGGQTAFGEVREVKVRLTRRRLIVETGGDEGLQLLSDPEDVRLIQRGSRVEIVECQEKEKAEEEGFLSLLQLVSNAINFTWNQEPVTLRVPPRLLADWDVDTGMQNVTWRQVGAGSLTVNTTGGDLSLHGLQARTVRLVTGSGDLDLDGDVQASSMVCHTLSGDIRGEAKGQEMEFHTTSGDVELSVTAEKADFNVISGDLSLKGTAGHMKVVSVSGDVEASVDGEDMSVSTTSGDVKLTGSMEHVDVHCVSGDLRLRMKIREIEVGSASGEIELQLSAAQDAESVTAQSRSGDVFICLAPGLNYQVMTDSRSGDILSRPATSGNGREIPVRVRTLSGDIRIE